MLHTLSMNGRAGRRLTIPAQGPLEMDKILDSINKNFERVCIVVAEEKVTPASDLAFTSVRFRSAVRVLPEPFGMAREFMDDMLMKTAKERQSLLESFGDCKVVAHIRQVLSTLNEVLPKMENQNDDRLERCSQACENMELVLKECGLGERLQQMMEIEKEEVAQLVRTVSEPQLDQPAPKMTSQQRQNLLQEIDDLIDGVETQAQALDKISLLFADYADGLGFLQGDSYDKAITDLTRYVRMEWDARNRRYVEEGKEQLALVYGKMTDATLRAWVTSAVDPNGDGCITKSEALKGFETVVNEIETPPSRQGSSESLSES